MPVSISAYGQYVPNVQLTEQGVACQPAGDWLHQFPAISQNNGEIAVLTDPDPESGIVFLQVLRVLDQSLQQELEFPLFVSRHVNSKECIEKVEAGTRESDVGSLKIITAANVHLSKNKFTPMFPLDARSIYGVTADTLPSESEEVISWGRYYISVDYRQSKVTISEIRRDDQGILVATDYGSGQRYFELRLSRKDGSGEPGATGSCIGVPVPLAVWTNRGQKSPDNDVFLMRIEYVSSGDCSFAGEWIVKVVER